MCVFRSMCLILLRLIMCLTVFLKLGTLSQKDRYTEREREREKEIEGEGDSL